MSKRAKIGDNNPLDKLFTPTGPTAPRPAPPAPVRTGATMTQPEPAGPELRQTTIMVYDQQLAWLETACYQARRAGGRNVSKAAIIRALIDLMEGCEVEWQGVSTDADIRQRLEAALVGK